MFSFGLALALLFTTLAAAQPPVYLHGAAVRGDSSRKELALVFTADEFSEGVPFIRQALRQAGVKAGFFFTGRLYRRPAMKKYIRQLQQDGHYLGPHSDAHLLYND